MALVNGQPVPYQTYQQRTQVAMQQASAGGSLNDRERMEIQGRAYHQLVEDLPPDPSGREARGLGTDLDEVLLLLRTNPPAEVDRESALSDRRAVRRLEVLSSTG